MNKPERIQSLDILRGMAMLFVILFHASIYNFANINKLDFSNPPIIIVLISFMALWGGIFIIYSMIVNTYLLTYRIEQSQNKNHLFHLFIVSFILIIAHYVLNILLGRWNIDFVNNQPDMTFVAATLRRGTILFPHYTKFFDGSSLSTIAFNLLFISTLIYFLLKNNGFQKMNRNYFVLASLGFLFMLFSYVRVDIYHCFDKAIASNNHFLSVIYSFLFSNPYPLLPYFGYGCFGAIVGLMILKQRKDLLKKVILPIGLFFFIFGIYGMMKFDKTISKPDYFWYFKTNFELGFFLLFIPGIYLLLEKKQKLIRNFAFLKWFSKISLTVYLLETLLSELMRLIINPIVPQWNQTINGSLLFGTLNIAVWIIILYFWKKVNYKYSLEYFWVQLFYKINKKSTKMDF